MLGDNRLFHCNQVIIVREEKDKELIPKFLKKKEGTVITIEECKGMEYDDVIIYNFFSPDSKQASEWRVLKYLDMFPQRGKTEFKLEHIKISDY